MTRYMYGAGGDSEINSATTGLPYAGVTANVYNARTGGSLVTDLQNLAGVSISQPVSDSFGQFAFMGPDAYTNTLWLDLGTGPRWAVKPTDVASIISSTAAAAVPSTVSSIRLSDYSSRVFTTKAALPKNTNDPLESTLADVLDPLVIPRFASQGARDTAFPSPADGDICYRTDLHAHQYYNSANTTWLVLQQGTWLTSTPTWSSSGTPPAIGNGTIVGRYTLLGKTVTYVGQITPGSTTTFGTGTYSVSLPVAAVNGTVGAYMGFARLSVSSFWAGNTLVAANTSVFGVRFSTSSTDPRLSNWSPTVPETFANGSTLYWSMVYEAA